MSKIPLKRFFNNIDVSRSIRLLNKEFNVLKQFQWSNSNTVDDDDELEMKRKDAVEGYCNGNNNNWKLEADWLVKTVEPALQLYKWALSSSGNGIVNKTPPVDRSFGEIFASIRRSKLGIEGWSLSDLTIGLYLIYLRQTTESAPEDVKGELISSESIVQDLIYHLELAHGAYKVNATSLARNSMLRENNIVKFIRNSSVLRPGYYIGIDMRRKLVVLGIRGTHSVYDLVTDIISSSHEEITSEGYSTHFGTAEAARWFLTHEIDTIRKCLEKHKDFRLRLVGHSLGGATASLLAIMLRDKSSEELGFSPDIVTAVGYATPPCVSKELAESCSEFVTTVVMQDDIIPRLSIASLSRLKDEIVETDWESIVNREDWKGVMDLVTNAKQVVSSVQDVARKLVEYANFRGQTNNSVIPMKEVTSMVPSFSGKSNSLSTSSSPVKHESPACKMAEDLFVPGTLYYLKRNGHESDGYFTLVKRKPDEHFQRILLSSNIISDHKCVSHSYALRDVLKGLPGLDDRSC